MINYGEYHLLRLGFLLSASNRIPGLHFKFSSFEYFGIYFFTKQSLMEIVVGFSGCIPST